MNLNKLTIKEAQKKLRNGEIKSIDIVQDCLNRIKEVDDKIKACITICEKEAISNAKIADERRLKGEDNDLLGIPYIAKDNILTKGIKTTASSKILENYTAPFDATIIKKLKESGAVLLAKANLDEFAHGASTENSAFFTTHNPWDLSRVPGGSSGGSTASVASDMCLFALGTDTGGSIRCPSAFCGVTGLKPSYGRSSRFGLIAMTSSTDVPGPITKTAEDAGIVLDVISGVDKNDATTIDNKFENFTTKANNDVKKIRIGIPKEYFDDKIDNDVKKIINSAIQKMKNNEIEFKEVNLPHTKYVVPVYYIITPSEISSNLARFDGIRYGLSDKEAKNLKEVYFKSRNKGFGNEVKLRIMLGTYALSAGYRDAYYLKAQKVRTKIKEEMENVLRDVDCLITPTSPHIAFTIGEQADDPVKMYLEDILVAGASLAGLPAISIPCGFSNKMPVGLQLIGNKFDEMSILKIANDYQKITDFHTKKPVI